MNILFYLIVCASLLIFVFIYLNIQGTTGISPAFETDDSMVNYILGAALLLFLLPATYFYKRKLKLIHGDFDLMEKLAHFRSAALIKYYILGAGCLLALVGLYITQEQVYLMAFGALLIVFSINRPTVYRIKKDVALTQEEKQHLVEYRKYL